MDSLPRARAADVAEIAAGLPTVVHDYPAAVLLVDTSTSEVVYANHLAGQLAPRAVLPVPVEQWSSKAGLQVVGGGMLGTSTTPLSQVAVGRPPAGREVTAELGSEAAGARESLWVIGLPLESAPEPLRRHSLVVLLPLRFPAAVAELQDAAAREGAHRSILTSDLAVSLSDPTAPDDPLVWVSDGFERVTGYSREQVLGRNCRFLQGPDTDPDTVARLREAIAAGTSVSETLLNYRADGTAFFNHLVISPVYDASGAMTHRVGIQTDVTQRVLVGREHAAALAALEGARGAQLAAERSRAFGQLLLTLSEALAATTTTADIAQTIATVAMKELGASGSALALPEAEGTHLSLRGFEHLATDTNALGGRIDVDQDTALAAVARTGAAGFYSDPAMLEAAHPRGNEQASPLGLSTCACLPLQLQEGGSGSAPRGRGVLLLTWEEPRVFAEEERAVLGALARYTSQALQRASLLAERRSAAQTLQESLLTTLPAVDHLQIRARYVPADTGEHVGGDWYDAIVLPSGATALVIGDVTGHDMAAAAQMGQLRGLLRAFAYDRQEPPTAIFHRLEGSLSALGVSTLATAVLATVEPPAEEEGWRLRWTNAGHPPPLFIHPDGATEALSTEPDLLLGLVPGTARHDHVRVLPMGATVLLYTDGLIEHRGRSLDQGLQELRATLARVAHLPLDDLLDVLVTDLIGAHPEDDCALVALRLQS